MRTLDTLNDNRIILNILEDELCPFDLELIYSVFLPLHRRRYNISLKYFFPWFSTLLNAYHLTRDSMSFLEAYAHFSKFPCVHAQSCPTLGDYIDCNTPGSSVDGIIQARILK